MSIGFFYLLGYILLVGFGTFLQKFSMKYFTPYQLEFVMAIGMLFVSISALLITQKSLMIPLKGLPTGGLVGILFAGGSLLFTLSLSKLPAGLASGISISYVLIVVLLSVLFLKEPINVLKIIGILLTVIGVGILYFQNTHT